MLVARRPESKPCLTRLSCKVDQEASIFNVADLQVRTKPEDLETMRLAVPVDTIDCLGGRRHGATIIASRVPWASAIQAIDTRHTPFHALVAFSRQVLHEMLWGKGG
ncbi:hypothetical protein D3C76_941520 [compost metagenome]